jgi:putative transcriptional regulator
MPEERIAASSEAPGDESGDTGDRDPGERVGGSSLAQQLLCAVPQLRDPNFVRSVVLIVDHTRKGAFGIVLNNPLATPIAEMAGAIGLQWHGPSDRKVRLGGPVEPSRGFILHDRPAWDPLADALTPELFLTTSLDAVKAGDPGSPRLGGGGSEALAFLGYAGWGAGQLEAEMAAGSWMVVPLRPESVPVGQAVRQGVTPSWLWSSSPESMWAEALRSVGIDPARLVGAGLGSGKAPQA